MRDYCIMTDSSCDFSAEMAEKLELTVVPLSILIDGKTYRNYLDGRELPNDEFYRRLRSGMQAATSGCSVGQFEEAMTLLLEQGKDILYLGFSSGLSVTYNAACIAAEHLKEKYPAQNICTVDTLCGSLGQGLVLYRAAEKKRQGMTMEEVAAYVESIRTRVHHWIMIEDLHHLKRGGRVSGTAALVGSMLKFKPIIAMDKAGRLHNVDKVRGRKAAMRYLAQKVRENIEQPVTEETVVAICHGDCPADAQKLTELIQEETGVEHFIVNALGPVIGNHTGADMLVVFFLAAAERMEME